MARFRCWLAPLLVVLVVSALVWCPDPAQAQASSAERPTYKIGDKWLRTDGTYTLTRIDTDIYVFISNSGNEVHLTKDLGVAKVVVAGQIVYDVDPAAWPTWPLEVGQLVQHWGSWNAVPRSFMRQWGTRVRVVLKVEANEQISVAAGTFKAFRISHVVFGSAGPDFERFVLWYSPDVRRLVKGQGDLPGFNWELTGTDKPGASPVITATTRAPQPTPEPPPPTITATPVDTEAPKIAINYPPPDTKVDRDSIVILGLVTDNVSVDRVQITVNGVEVTQPRDVDVVGRGVPIRVPTVLQPGNNLIEITAADTAGNVAQLVRTVIRVVAVASTRPPSPELARPTVAPSVLAALGRYHALVIGNQAYRHLKHLQSPVADATAVADLLRREYRFTSVQLLTNATRTEIVDALDDLRRTLKEDDNLVIYYAGHGWLDRDTDRGYWLPIDADQEGRANWLSNADITDTLKALKARHVLVVADSCYSGTLTRGIGVVPSGPVDVLRLARKRARTALTSGGLEPVLDTGSGSHSVFARAFMDVLRGNQGAADLTSLFAMIRRQVLLGAEQTPEYADIRQAGHDGGDFVFVRRR